MTEYHAYAILLVLVVAGAIRIGYFCGHQIGRREAWHDAWDAGFKEAERQEQVRQIVERRGSYLNDNGRTWVPREPRTSRPNWIRRVK